MLSKIKMNLFQYNPLKMKKDDTTHLGQPISPPSFDYNPDDFVPRQSLYRLYFTQNRRKLPQKFGTLLVSSYFGGVFFGVLMMGFSMMGTFGLGSPEMTGEMSYKYKDMAEFWGMTKMQIASLHSNGIYVIRYTLSIALFNLLMTYLPILSPSFSEFYGYGNLHALFNFAIPCYIFIKFRNVSIFKRMLYSSCSLLLYQAYKFAKNPRQMTKKISEIKTQLF